MAKEWIDVLSYFFSSLLGYKVSYLAHEQLFLSLFRMHSLDAR